MNNLVFQFFSIIFIKMCVFHYKHMGTMCKMSNYIHKMLLNTRGTASIVFLVTKTTYGPRLPNSPSLEGKYSEHGSGRRGAPCFDGLCGYICHLEWGPGKE